MRALDLSDEALLAAIKGLLAGTAIDAAASFLTLCTKLGAKRNKEAAVPAKHAYIAVKKKDTHTYT